MSQIESYYVILSLVVVGIFLIGVVVLGIVISKIHKAKSTYIDSDNLTNYYSKNPHIVHHNAADDLYDPFHH